MDATKAQAIISRAHADGISPLKAVRDAAGLALNELATAARVDPQLIALIEEQSGAAAPTLKHRQAIAEVLGVPEEMLFHFGD